MASINSSGTGAVSNLSYNVTDYGPHTDYESIQDILTFQYYAWGVAGNIISGLGILGNLLSVIVLANRRMRSSTSVYLIAQSAFDILVLISLILFMALPTIHYKTELLSEYAAAYPYLHPFAYPLALTAQTCSIYTTVGFTVERYIAVCHPLKSPRWCNAQKARRAILIIVFSAIVYNIPRMLEYRTEFVFDPYMNQTKATYSYTAIGQNKTFRHIYFIYMHMTVMMLVPFSLLTFMNTMLIRAVRRSQHTKGKVNQKQTKENNLTVMLIAVVIVFLICQVPSIVDNVFLATQSDERLATAPFVKVTCISSLMVITNSAANFYLYCVFGNKFRRTFVRIFCSCYRIRGRTKAFLEHETSLLRGSSMAHRDTTSKNGAMRLNVHRESGQHSLDRKSLRSTTPPMYRYTGKGLKISVGTSGKMAKSSNGQARYTVIKGAEDAPETNL